MSFKSEAQKNHAKKQVDEGKMTEERYQELLQKTPAKIPDRIHLKQITKIKKMRSIK
jgi:hypothetical protein